MKIRQLLRIGKSRSEGGFSMIEATIGLGILGTVVGALLSGFTSGLFTMQMARENLRATQIMLERMETIRLYSWAQINETNFVAPTFYAKYDPNSANAGVTYRGTVSISPSEMDATYKNNMRLVTVKLEWKTGNLSRAREFTSYVSRSGMQNYVY